MKKRVLAGIFAGFMAMSMLAGCGGSSESAVPAASSAAASETAEAASETAEAASGTAEAAEESGEPLHMTLIMSIRDEWLSSMESACKQKAEEMGIELTTQDANNDQSKQIQYIETAKNAGEDAVLLNIIDAETAEQCIEAADGMPIIFINRAPADLTLLDKYENAAMVASDEMQSGGFQAEYLAKYFDEKGQKDVKYILLSGVLGQVSTTNRTKSVLEGLQAAGLNIEEIQTLNAKYDRAEAQNLISPLLTTEDYDCIIANNDAMALGAIEAMKSANIEPSSVPIVGVDCTKDGAAAVKAGEMYMTVFQDPAGQGEGAIYAAQNLLKGNKINTDTDYELAEESEKIMWVPFVPVTIDNVDEYL
ncbi:MAG: sugar ABC transporter substrate-binding protein [Eubacterium sp.]|nr:sugar ABC transporter substrate-binding protein [Eubacterium sp.]